MAARAARPHVLVVDAYPEVAEVVGTALSATGRYRITCLSDTAEACALIASARPDLMLVDAGPNGRAGLPLAAHALAAGVEILVMTALPPLASRIAREGVPVLEKPFRIAQLLSRVSAALAADGDDERRSRAARRAVAGSLEKIAGRAAHLDALGAAVPMAMGAGDTVH